MRNVNGMGLAHEEYLTGVKVPTNEQVQRARRAVAGIDATVEERATLLLMLGIGPDLALETE